MNSDFHEAQIAKIYEDIERSQVERQKMRLETAKITKELRWSKFRLLLQLH